MGLRAHQRIVSTIEYDNSSSFNWGIEELANLLVQYCPNSRIDGETGVLDSWELYVPDIQEAIENLSKKNQDEKVVNEYTVKDVIEILKQWLNTQAINKENIEFSDYIYIDWF